MNANMRDADKMNANNRNSRQASQEAGVLQAAGQNGPVGEGGGVAEDARGRAGERSGRLLSDRDSGSQRMKAVHYERYGGPEVLEIREVEKPTPGAHEIRIKIHATTVTTGDYRARSLNMPSGFGLLGRLVFGITGPRQPILGSELAGEVDAVGKDVTKFKVGDRVFGFGGAGMGCNAQYRCLSEHGLVALKPANLTFQQAAPLCFGGTTALHFLRKANVQKGERVLIIGASGTVGSACLQLARHYGAEVTAVCSRSSAELVRSLGAAQVIDYAQGDIFQQGQTYDVIVDAVGKGVFSRCVEALSERGRLLLISGGLPEMLQSPWVALSSKKRVLAGVAQVTAEDLRTLAGLAEAGTFIPAIDREYPLEQIVEAHRYLDGGHRKGNVVLTVGH